MQERFGTRALADLWTERGVLTDELADWQVRLIERAPFFWLASADLDGWPDVSYKGGVPGFVHVAPDRRSISFPHYDGNGMFRSLGNLTENPRVGLLFIDFDRPKRFRVKGMATITDDAPGLAEHPGADVVVTVSLDVAFSNCPRYVHKSGETPSPFAPDGINTPPEPEWKQDPEVRRHLPASS